MDEKITVIIPVFNGEKYLERTLDSLINQSFGFENIEVIIADDCSTDNTANIMREYSDRYPNIKCFFLKKNYGAAGKGRNVGLENASADYIMFLDSDDEFAPDMCEVMYSAITREDVDFVMCRYDMYIDGEFAGHNKSFLEERDDETRVDSLMNNLDMISTCSNMVVWNKIYKKELIKANGMKFVDDRYNEDYLFENGVYLTAESFVSLNHFYGHRYHILSESASNAGSAKFFDDGIFVLDRVEELFEKKGFSHHEVVNEYVVIMTQGLLKSDMENSKKKDFFRRMKPYYRKYGLSYRLINNVSLPFNIAINIAIKLFSVSASFASVASRIFKMISR